jgi:hypothetical protein
MKKIQLSLLVAASLFLSACAQKSDENSVNLDSTYKEKLSYLKNKYTEKNETKITRNEMLKEDADYMQKNPGHAIVENKNYDYPSNKPVFVEPIFAKVEFMPYETKEGIWHEQQSVWIKVKEGQIALKSNPNNADTVLDQYKSILSK